jgi:2-polyprenyl-3-methyl-5-hydroxy-6-metoxy-1,4-benzoquinol methylase
MQQHKDDYAEKLLNICTSIVENRLRSGFLLDHEVDVLRISQVTGKTRDKVEQCLLEELQNPGSNVNAARLAAGPPKDISEIEAFYRSNEAYLYDLVVAHATWERYLWRTTALSILIKLGCKSVLDYGAGIGRDSLFFASAGLKVTYYDMNEYLRRFAEDFANSKQIQLITITNTDVLPNGLFDAVYCTKVLEYVPNPLKELKRMRRLIKRRGYLLATESFEAVGDRFLTHLAFLSVYSGRLPAIAEQVGLSLREIIPIPGNKIFVFEGI